MKKINFLKLIRTEKSIEIPYNDETSNKNTNLISPSIIPTKSEYQVTLTDPSKITWSKNESLRKQSLYDSSDQMMEETFNEGLIQKKVELHLVKIKFPFPVISPFGNFIKIWTFFMIILMIYITMVFPIRLAFIDDNTDWITADVFLDSIFMVDMIVNSLTAYENIDGILVFQLHQIMFNYFKGWFIIDLISTLPIYLMIEGADLNKITKMGSIYKLLKILRLFRLIKLISFITKMLMNFKISKESIEICKLMFFVFILLHITGCIWIMVAQIEVSPDTWVIHYQLIDEDSFTIYITSIYYVLTILITLGYGNVTAITSTEKAFVSVFMFLGIGVYGYIMVNTMKAFENKGNSQIQSKELFFISLAQILGLPNKTVEKILIRNQKLNISTTINKIDAFHKQDIFNDLPFSLQKELFSYIYSEFLEKIEFFHDKPFSFLVPILEKLRPIFLKKGDEVYKEGDIANEVYFILKGRVVSKCKDKFGNIKTVLFMEGGYFGEADVILKRERWESAYAETDVEIWKLTKRDFLHCLKPFKDIKKEVKNLVFEKVKVRKASSNNFKTLKYLLPSTYFISKMRHSTRNKSTLNHILKRSNILQDERKKLEEEVNESETVDLRRLYLKGDTLKLADRNKIFETTSDEIDDLALKEILKFFKHNGLNFEDFNFRFLIKIPTFFKNQRELVEKNKINFEDEKINNVLSIVKYLNGVLKSQEEELLSTMKFIED